MEISLKWYSGECSTLYSFVLIIHCVYKYIEYKLSIMLPPGVKRTN